MPGLCAAQLRSPPLGHHLQFLVSFLLGQECQESNYFPFSKIPFVAQKRACYHFFSKIIPLFLGTQHGVSKTDGGAGVFSKT